MEAALQPQQGFRLGAHVFRLRGGMHLNGCIALEGIQRKADTLTDAGRLIQVEMMKRFSVNADGKDNAADTAIDPGICGGTVHRNISRNQLQGRGCVFADMLGSLGPLGYHGAKLLESKLVQILDHGSTPGKENNRITDRDPVII